MTSTHHNSEEELVANAFRKFVCDSVPQISLSSTTHTVKQRPAEFYRHYVNKNVRPDGRKLQVFRNTEITLGM